MQANRAQVVVGFVAAIALLIVVIWAFLTFAHVFGQANASVQAAIIAGSGALASLLVTNWLQRSKAIKEAHREQKIAVYNQFYDIMFRMLRDPDNKIETENLTRESPLVRQLSEVTRGVLFYGSPKVVKAFSEFRTMSDGASRDPKHPFRVVGRILLAMRDDIGLSNSGLDELNIHQLYVTDDLSRFGESK